MPTNNRNKRALTCCDVALTGLESLPWTHPGQALLHILCYDMFTHALLACHDMATHALHRCHLA